jgi:hypothetical protein
LFKEISQTRGERHEGAKARKHDCRGEKFFVLTEDTKAPSPRKKRQMHNPPVSAAQLTGAWKANGYSNNLIPLKNNFSIRKIYVILHACYKKIKEP